MAAVTSSRSCSNRRELLLLANANILIFHIYKLLTCTMSFMLIYRAGLVGGGSSTKRVLGYFSTGTGMDSCHARMGTSQNRRDGRPRAPQWTGGAVGRGHRRQPQRVTGQAC